MNGIRITGQPTFQELFAPIFPALKGLVWVTEPDSFRFPNAWLDESSFDETSETFTSGPCAELARDLPLVSDGRIQHGRYSTTDIFPKYAEAVDDDWNAIFGLRMPVDAAIDWMKDYFKVKDRVAHVAKARVCFFSVDSAYWELLAHDEQLIETVRRHLQTLDVSVVDSRLADAIL